MARTNLPLSTLAPNNAIAAPAGTTIDQANGMNVQLPTTAIPAAPDSDHLILLVTNSAASAKVITVKAGSGPAAFRSGIGDLNVSINASASQYIGPFESARFAQTDGSINVDFATGTTGTITALIMPVRW